jgi:hypothetical protein
LAYPTLAMILAGFAWGYAAGAGTILLVHTLSWNAYWRKHRQHRPTSGKEDWPLGSAR